MQIWLKEIWLGANSISAPQNLAVGSLNPSSFTAKGIIILVPWRGCDPQPARRFRVSKLFKSSAKFSSERWHTSHEWRGVGSRRGRVARRLSRLVVRSNVGRDAVGDERVTDQFRTRLWRHREESHFSGSILFESSFNHTLFIVWLTSNAT